MNFSVATLDTGAADWFSSDPPSVGSWFGAHLDGATWSRATRLDEVERGIWSTGHLDPLVARVDVSTSAPDLTLNEVRRAILNTRLWSAVESAVESFESDPTAWGASAHTPDSVREARQVIASLRDSDIPPPKVYLDSDGDVTLTWRHLGSADPAVIIGQGKALLFSLAMNASPDDCQTFEFARGDAELERIGTSLRAFASDL